MCGCEQLAYNYLFKKQIEKERVTTSKLEKERRKNRNYQSFPTSDKAPQILKNKKKKGI